MDKQRGRPKGVLNKNKVRFEMIEKRLHILEEINGITTGKSATEQPTAQTGEPIANTTA